MKLLLFSTAILACIWLLAMALMRRTAPRCRAQRVQTLQGPLWVECRQLPDPGQSIKAYGHPAQGAARYDARQAKWGVLRASGQEYHWEPTSRNRYA